MAHTLSKSGDLWTKEGTFVVVGNNALKRGVISLFHDSTMAGHPRITKTLALMKPYYWWPNMKNFVTEYIKGCATCQMTKVNTQPTRPPLLRRDTGFLVFSFPRSLGSGVYDEINGGQRKLVRT